MLDSRIQAREEAYRTASRRLDFFVTGLTSLFFLSSLFFLGGGNGTFGVVHLVAAPVLFALSIVAGLKKLEYFVAILGTDYTTSLTEADRTSLTVRESTAVLRDLKSTIELLSARASVAHRIRNWSLVLGLVLMIGSRMLEMYPGS